jgi:hypothetical protein
MSTLDIVGAVLALHVVGTFGVAMVELGATPSLVLLDRMASWQMAPIFRWVM